MSLTVDQIETEILSLPENDRARLFGSLLRSFEGTSRDDQVAQTWVAEAEKRDQAMEDENDPGIPAEEVFQRLRTSLR